MSLVFIAVRDDFGFNSSYCYKTIVNTIILKILTCKTVFTDDIAL